MPWASLLSYKLQEHITTGSQVHCFSKYFKSESFECPLNSAFLLSSSFWSLSVSCSFSLKIVSFIWHLRCFQGRDHPEMPFTVSSEMEHNLFLLSQAGEVRMPHSSWCSWGRQRQALCLFALDFPSLD